MALEIRTTWSKIGIQTYRPFLEIQQPSGKLKIKSQKTQLVIDRELPRVLIDQSACFKELGFKTPMEFTAEMAQKARQRALEYVGEIAEEGDFLARLEYKGPHPLAELALRRMERDDYLEWNFDLLPKSRPKFDVRGHLKIDWQVLEGKVEFEPRPPQLHYRPWVTKIYLRQQGEVQIRYIDEKV